MSPRKIAHIAVTLVACGLAVLYRFPPLQYSFYPVCPFAHWTDLQCPGCGSTRALHALLHGQISEAMHFNALFTLLFPLLVLWMAAQYWSAIRQNRFFQVDMPTMLYRVAALAVVLFGIARNIPKQDFF